jgi:hypothetical protein
MACLIVLAVRAICAISDADGNALRAHMIPIFTSCHLDAAGIAKACRAVLDQIPMSDLVVFNKFGKLESMEEGLATAFRVAIRSGNQY